MSSLDKVDNILDDIRKFVPGIFKENPCGPNKFQCWKVSGGDPVCKPQRFVCNHNQKNWSCPDDKELCDVHMHKKRPFSISKQLEKLDAVFEKVAQIPQIFMQDVEDTCFAHKDENSCNADGPCSWCDAAAVKPACHSIDNAKSLPAAVFSCSKLTEEEKKEEPVKVEIKTPFTDIEGTCNAHKDENSCNADGPCSWCDAAAVKPACHSIDNAKSLPPAVF